MTATSLQAKFELLKALYRLSQEQSSALEADRLDLFAQIMTTRETLVEQLMSITDEELPKNVIPFPTLNLPQSKGEEEMALGAVVRGILETDAKNERLLREKLGEVKEILAGIGRAKKAAQAYKAQRSPGRRLDRTA